MRSLLAISVLSLALLAQFGVALVSAQNLLDGLGVNDLLTLLRGLDTQIALAACVGGAVFGALILAVAAWRRGAFWLAPMLLPLLWPVALRLGPDTDLLAIVIDHAAIGLAVGSFCGVLSLSRLSRNVMRAALLCGVSPLGAVRRVMLPVLAPGLLAAVLLAASYSLLLSFLRAQPDGAVDLSALTSIPLMSWWPAAAAVFVVLLLSSGITRLLRD